MTLPHPRTDRRASIKSPSSTAIAMRHECIPCRGSTPAAVPVILNAGRMTHGAWAGGWCEENEGVVHRQQFLLNESTTLTSRSARLVVLSMLVVSVGLLIPGLLAPVLTIRGVLTREGIAQLAPQLLERGLSDDTMNVLKSVMNPAIVAFVEGTGGDLRKSVLDKLTPQITASLEKNVGEVVVYEQTRSIVGSVRRLYEVGSPMPATLILLFSVIVPLLKAGLVAWAVFVASSQHRRRMLAFVETIAKWSMADVFVVALFIAFLAAQASAAPAQGPNAAPPLIAFSAHFGAGFYWFAAYCLFSLASQQMTVRLAKAPAVSGVTPEFRRD